MRSWRPHGLIMPASPVVRPVAASTNRRELSVCRHPKEFATMAGAPLRAGRGRLLVGWGVEHVTHFGSRSAGDDDAGGLVG